MIPLDKDADDLPRWVRAVAEHCCFCAAPTRLWYKPKDVAVCARCGETRNPDEVPTKEEWWGSPQAKGVVPDDASTSGETKTMTDMTEMFEEPVRTVGLTVNAPAVFMRPDFMAWLNDPATRVMTWHAKGQAVADEYADVLVLVDSNYEGTNADDMPEDVWRAICDLAYAEYGGPEAPRSLGSHIAVRLTNLAL